MDALILVLYLIYYSGYIRVLIFALMAFTACILGLAFILDLIAEIKDSHFDENLHYIETAHQWSNMFLPQ